MLRSRHRSETPNFMCCLAEEREQSTFARFVCPKAHGLEAWQAEPPPTFPFLESQCQRAPTKGEFSFCSRWSAARKKRPAERRGRGLYEGVYPKSNPKKQIISGPVDR